ncbi:hypothetical protein BC833DRAFT_567668 [Globomyces pollinis-pini]|nr:hypothetical protein BC833DRAFT_567668 [Globomyces pollinis-pini]
MEELSEKIQLIKNKLDAYGGTKRAKTKKIELRGHRGQYINFNGISDIQTNGKVNIAETKYIHSSWMTSNFPHVPKERCGPHVAYNDTGLAAGKADSGNFPMVHSDRPASGNLREELWIMLKDEHVIDSIQFEPRPGCENRLIDAEVIIRTGDDNAIYSANIGADYKVVFPPVFV